MIPYTSFLYFGILLIYIVIPAIIVGFFKRISKIWLVIATLVMLVIQYYVPQQITKSISVNELELVAIYAVLQWLIAIIFLLIRKRGKNQFAFYMAVLLSLLPLLAAKFIPLFQPDYQIFFLGLSYITFRSLDVIIGIHDGMIASLPPIQYLTFLLFFPTISSGPIDRYNRFNEDWKRERTRTEFLSDLDGFVHRVFTGFLYKFILGFANPTILAQSDVEGRQSFAHRLLHVRVYLLSVLRLCRLQRLRSWIQLFVRHSHAGKFQPSIPFARHPRVLELLAHEFVVLVPRPHLQSLRLHCAEK